MQNDQLRWNKAKGRAMWLHVEGKEVLPFTLGQPMFRIISKWKMGEGPEVILH